MENTNLTPPLPEGLEKHAVNWGQVGKGALSALGKAKGALVGYGDDALRQRGVLKDIRKHVTRSGWDTHAYNRAINVGSSAVDDATKAFTNPTLIKGTSLAGSGATQAIKDPSKLINKWWNPFGQYMGGEAGINTLKSRFQQ